jgi:hypothetical protein
MLSVPDMAVGSRDPVYFPIAESGEPPESRAPFREPARASREVHWAAEHCYVDRPAAYWLTAASLSEPFPSLTAVHPTDRPPFLAVRVHSLVPSVLFGVPSTALPATPCDATIPARVSPLIATSPAASTHVGFPGPTSFRPQVFSTSRRLPPPPALRACFIPLSRPGFPVQGVLPIRSGHDSSPHPASVPFRRTCSPASRLPPARRSTSRLPSANRCVPRTR